MKIRLKGILAAAHKAAPYVAIALALAGKANAAAAINQVDAAFPSR